MNAIEVKEIYNWIVSNYANINATAVVYIGSGLHCNYRVETINGPIHCRIYRKSWKAESEIQYELSALEYLFNNGISYVSRSIKNNAGTQYSEIEVNKERYFCALFTWADGQLLADKNDKNTIFNLGSAVARFHQAGLRFRYGNCPDTRRFNADYLGRSSYSAISPYLNDQQRNSVQTVISSAELLFSQLNSDRAPMSILSGDINLTNFHVDKMGGINIFDFDQCGWGYMVFEIAKFKSSLYRERAPQIIYDYFLEGYISTRALSTIEFEAIEILEKLAIIWVMAIHVWNIDVVGRDRLGPDYWNIQIERLG